MSAMADELQAFRRERNQALRTLDLAWARGLIPGGNEEALLVALHKVRYHCAAIEPALRIESAEWLRTRGLHDLGGLPLLPPGELPAGV
jgi:hypothetical protein